jgi:hypothetical protein
MRSGETIGASKGVILATGGYGANPQMSWQFEQLPGFAQEASGLMPASLNTSHSPVFGRKPFHVLIGEHRHIASVQCLEKMADQT